MDRNPGCNLNQISQVKSMTQTVQGSHPLDKLTKLREAFYKKARKLRTDISVFGGVFPNITEPILYDENSKKCQNLPPKSDHFTPKLMSIY